MLTSPRIKARASELGFDLCGIAPAGEFPELGFLRQWIDRGYAAGLDYVVRRAEERIDPRLVLPGARSIIAVGWWLGGRRGIDLQTLADLSLLVASPALMFSVLAGTTLDVAQLATLAGGTLWIAGGTAILAIVYRRAAGVGYGALLGRADVAGTDRAAEEFTKSGSVERSVHRLPRNTVRSMGQAVSIQTGGCRDLRDLVVGTGRSRWH